MLKSLDRCQTMKQNNIGKYWIVYLVVGQTRYIRINQLMLSLELWNLNDANSDYVDDDEIDLNEICDDPVFDVIIDGPIT